MSFFGTACGLRCGVAAVVLAGFLAAQDTTTASSAGQPGQSTTAPSGATQAAPNAASPVAAPAPAHKPITLGELVMSAIQQEKRMTNLMRNFKPIVETYVQEQQPDQALGTSPRTDEYFLSRLDVSGKSASTQAFTEDKKSKGAEMFAAGGFADSLFPDLDHFDLQNYDFE